MNAETPTAAAQQTAVTVAKPQRAEMIVVQDTSSFANLLDTGKFEHMWRVARTFAASKMVPTIFQDKPEDCFVAIQMAVRLEVDPFMFMQNTYPAPGGKPAMEGKLAIALINARGPFRGGVQFRFSGKGDGYGCTAFGIHRDDGQERAITVTIKIAKDEGWYGRNKKWQTMPDQMLIYRSGAWLGRAFCPEVLMGMRTLDEAEDMGDLRQGDDGTYAPAKIPPRPTRTTAASAQATDDGASTDEPAAAPTFEFVDGQGEITAYADPDAYNDAFIVAMRRAPREIDVQGIWETNSQTLDALRGVGPEGVKLAEEIHEAYREELDAKKRAEHKAASPSAPAQAEKPAGDPRSEPPAEGEAQQEQPVDDNQALYEELRGEILAQKTAKDIHIWMKDRAHHMAILKANAVALHADLIKTADKRQRELAAGR